ncbi:hypothetical protein H9P43_005613 [Blastocladiella emersonii ATCC 22665]|nr:hypothetical protein H9P43_005613 [Blastocladiella emersonii ATCC 22665]
MVILPYMVGTYPWGVVSDRYGRKVVLIVGYALTSVFMILFGFSSSFAWSIVWRTAMGLANGVLSTAKAQMAEVCAPEHLSRGYSIMTVGWSLGMILAPSIGGYLARPALQYPGLFAADSFFGVWPYALPTLVGGILGLLVCAFMYWCLPETLPNPTPIPGLTWLQDIGKDGRTRLTAQKEDAAAAAAATADPKAKDADTGAVKSVDDRPLTFLELISTRTALIVCLLYFCTSAVDVAFLEAAILWARLPRPEGGLALESADFGFISSVCGAINLAYQLVLFPSFERRFGALTVYRVGTLVPIAVHILYPRVPQLVPGLVDTVWGSRIVLLVLQVVFEINATNSFTSVFVMVSNATLTKDRGAMNGLGQAFASLSRIIAPIVTGSLFSLSLYSTSEPFDYHLIFYVMSLLALVTGGLTLMLDSSINAPLGDGKDGDDEKVDADDD